MSDCPAGDDYVADVCGCKPVAASAGPTSPEPDAYPCGDHATCDGQTQTCEHLVGAAPGNDRYRCIALPQACVQYVSCACLIAAFGDRDALHCAGEGRRLTLRIDVR